MITSIDQLINQLSVYRDLHGTTAPVAIDVTEVVGHLRVTALAYDTASNRVLLCSSVRDRA